jgi:acyl-Coa thioesterase superfamily protein/acyl-CoA thioesterase superfamily protein
VGLGPAAGPASVTPVENAPFFAVTDAGLVPHPAARSPWAADMLHGRLLAGLAAWAIERDHGAPELQPARLTVDLFRFPAMAPTQVATSLARRGGRVRVVDAVLHIEGVEVARASSLFLRRGEVGADDDAPRTPRWDAPLPDDQEPADMPADVPFDVRPAGDRGFGAPGAGDRQVWLRDRRPLVPGVELTPFVRAALAADFASPLANMASEGLAYINADLTLHLARLPAGEWLGLRTGDRVAAGGISVAECTIHDLSGPVGWSSVCAVANPRMPAPG